MLQELSRKNQKLIKENVELKKKNDSLFVQTQKLINENFSIRDIKKEHNEEVKKTNEKMQALIQENTNFRFALEMGWNWEDLYENQDELPFCKALEE